MSRLSPKLLAELNEAIARRRLEAVSDEIHRNADECFAMIAVEQDDYSSPGNTRFGGDPDLPISMEWPTDGDSSTRKYCNFLAQINLEELPSLGAGDALPATGILYIFLRQLISAADPVSIDAIYFDGDQSTLRRRVLPKNTAYCDPYSVELTPQRVSAVPAVSVATFRQDFNRLVERNATEIDGESGELQLIGLQSDLQRQGQIGQLLGFANSHEGNSLYRHVALSRLGKRDLIFNDYWNSMEEYEAYIESWRENEDLVRSYEAMRNGVSWLIANQRAICEQADEWKLLLQVFSNTQMNLNINDFDPLYCFIRSKDLPKGDFSDLAGEVTQG